VSAPLEIRDLGVAPYADVLALQRDLCRARGDGALPQDVLLLVQHPSVYTFGRGTRDASLPLSPAQLAADGSEVVEIERGGDVTWHGPGQLVGYPILHLAALREDLHWYLRELEQALIDALGTLGVSAERNPGYTGVWTGGRKLASIGIHVKRWVTMHGFALNVVNDLRPFERIVPCGISGVTMTSVARELGTAEDPATLWERTQAAVTTAIAVRFDRRPVFEGAHS
jgi:lipoyl(octanoyl) transferase